MGEGGAGKTCQKMAKNEPVFNFPEKMLFGRVSRGQRYFSDHEFYTGYGFSLGAGLCKFLAIPKRSAFN